MKRLTITIEDHAMPQLITSALEAYEFGRKTSRKHETQLETFGLLWGYILPERGSRPPRIIATTATVETSAFATNHSVTPNWDSLRMKMEFVMRYWPHLEVVGTFHSHPYKTRKEVEACHGWQASNGDNEGDMHFWPELHKELFKYNPHLAHLIITITALQRKGWALPKEIENRSGFELSLGKRKLWITSYASATNEGENKFEMMSKLPILDIPSLTNRAIEGNFSNPVFS